MLDEDSIEKCLTNLSQRLDDLMNEIDRVPTDSTTITVTYREIKDYVDREIKKIKKIPSDLKTTDTHLLLEPALTEIALNLRERRDSKNIDRIFTSLYDANITAIHYKHERL